MRSAIISQSRWYKISVRSLALHPEQVQMQKQLANSLDDLREGVEAAKRIVGERCRMGEDGDSQLRSVSEPLPGAAGIENTWMLNVRLG
jgi:hypothetical protein